MLVQKGLAFGSGWWFWCGLLGVSFTGFISYCGSSLQVWLLYVLYVSIGLFHAVDIRICLHCLLVLSLLLFFL